MLENSSPIVAYNRRTPLLTRLMLFAICILSFGGFRFQLAGFDPTRSLQNFNANTTVYIFDGLCFVVAGCICLMNFRHFINLFGKSFPFTLLPLMAFASCIVSISPYTTAFEAIKYLAAFIIPMAAFIVWSKSDNGTSLSYSLLKSIILLSLINILLFPKYGVHSAADAFQFVHAGSWRGIFGHRTDFGYCCAIFAAFSFAKFAQRKTYGHLTAMLVAFFCLYQANSGGSYITALFSIITIYLYRIVKNQTHSVKIAMFLLFSSLSPVVMFLMIDSDFFLSIFGKDASLTGRTPLWTFIVNTTPLNYVYGLGYGSAFDLYIRPYLEAAGFNAPNAQGAYLEALIAFGLIGPVVILSFTAVIFSSVVKIFFDKAADGDGKYERFYTSCTLFFLMVTSNIVESYILQSNKILVGIAVIMLLERFPFMLDRIRKS